jgi:hypothetical protein
VRSTSARGPKKRSFVSLFVVTPSRGSLLKSVTCSTVTSAIVSSAAGVAVTIAGRDRTPQLPTQPTQVINGK